MRQGGVRSGKVMFGSARLGLVWFGFKSFRGRVR